MSNRVPWDIYESALLLDTYFRIERGEISQKAAEKELSDKLRAAALRDGDSIDDNYRNQNGISRQLGCMKYVMTQRGYSHAAKIFRDIARTYREEPEEYARILWQAKRRISGANSSKK